MKSQKNVRKPLARKRHHNPSLSYLDSAPLRQKSYDRETGLVYDELEVSGTRSSGLGWIGEFATPNLVRTRRRPNEQNGARRLYDMIVGKLGTESSDLTVEALQYLPWTLGQHIWGSICANHAESFYIWRTFAIAFGREFADPARRYLLDLKSPTLAIADYQRGITSKKNEWLTCLRISPKQVAVSDLVSISSVSNLTVLDLTDGQHSIENRESTFDIRVLRSWSELAKTGRAFQNLCVLLLGWQEKIDVRIFDFLDNFPKLRLLIVSRCRNFDHKTHRDWEEDAWSHDWLFMPSKRGVKHLRTLLDDKSLRLGKVANMHHESGRDPTSSDSEASLAPNIPLLEVWFGTPRAWTHILDEYAGTGTVYFRRKQQQKSDSLQKTPKIQRVEHQRGPTSTESPATSTTTQKSLGTRRRDTKQSIASLLAGMDSGSPK